MALKNVLPSHPKAPFAYQLSKKTQNFPHVIMCREPASFNTIYRMALNETTHKKGGKPQATVEKHHQHAILTAIVEMCASKCNDNTEYG